MSYQSKHGKKKTAKAKNRRLLWILIAAAFLLAALLVGLLLELTREPDLSDEPDIPDVVVSSFPVPPDDQPTVSPEVSAEPESTTEPEPLTTEEPEPFESPEPTETVAPIVSPSVKPTQNVEASQTIKFPYTISGEKLKVIQFTSFDGVYIEDGSDVNVEGIAVIRLTNMGKTPIEYVKIDMKQGSRTLSFVGTDIEGGGFIIIQEASRQAFSKDPIESCVVSGIARMDELSQAPELKVVENEKGGLDVTNLTDIVIPSARIFYKLYLEDENYYLGGITYTAKLTGLEPGETVTVTPSHYAAGYSRVLMTRIYDTEE